MLLQEILWIVRAYVCMRVCVLLRAPSLCESLSMSILALARASAHPGEDHPTSEKITLKRSSIERSSIIDTGRIMDSRTCRGNKMH